jgi:O-antigen/teichoic acid export membrane protein
LDIKKKFVADIGIIGIRNILASLSILFILAILTKTLGAHAYGIWVQITVTITLLNFVASLGLPYAMVRFLSGEKNREAIQEGLYSTAVIVFFIGSIIAFLLIIISEHYSIFFGDVKGIIKIVALIVPIWSVDGVFFDFFRAFRQMKTILVFTIIQSSGEVGLIAYLLLFSDYGLYEAVLSLLAVRTILFLVMGYSIVSKLGVKIPNFSRIREYLSFSLPTVPGNMSTWIVNSSDLYIIGFFLGATFVGYYSPGYTLGNITGMFLAPLGFVLPAALSKLYDGNNMTEVKTHLQYSLKYFLALAIPSTFGVSILSKQLLTILSTPDIASQGYLITPFVAVSALLFGAYTIIFHILVVTKKTRIVGSIWILAAILNLGLNMLVVPYIGILGAAITTLLAFTLVLTLVSFYSFKYFKFDVDFRFILKSIFASIVMCLVIIKWSPVGTLNVLIVIGVCAVVYAAVLLLLKGFTKEEFEFFKTYLNTNR